MDIYGVCKEDLQQLGLNEISIIQDPLEFDNLDTQKSETLGYFSNIPAKKDEIKSTLIVLPKRTSLWGVSMDYFDKIMKETKSDLLGVMCMKLTSPRGSQSRRWISYQNGQSNFNVNIIFKKYSEFIRSWELQQKISLSIAETLTNFSGNRGVEIIPPFHYCIDKRKVAGHLVTQDQIGDQGIIRIGLGINTNSDIQLPENDDLGNGLFNGTSSLGLTQKNWIEIYQRLVAKIDNNVICNFSNCTPNISKRFFEFLSIKLGDHINIYKDNGTTKFGDFIDQGLISAIDYERGLFVVNNKNYDIGSYFFVKNNHA